MTFWELVKGHVFYWQMFTLHNGRQIIADGRTDQRPILMPSGQVYVRRIAAPANLSMYRIGNNDPDGWVAHFAGTTLTVRMLKDVKERSPKQHEM